MKIVMIPVARLEPHPDNPRKELGDLTELADSIRANGVLQNLTVVYHPETEGAFRVVIGHRRLAAAKAACVIELPCVIADMTPEEQFTTMMVENIQRSALTPIEEAEGFQMMLDMGDTVAGVAEKTGVSETTVRRRVKLVELPREKLLASQGRGGRMEDYLKLSQIEDEKDRVAALDAIGTDDFNWKVKDAMERQAFRKLLREQIAALETADWCRKRTDEEVGYGRGYESWKRFTKWEKKPIPVPKDLDVAQYIWSVTGEEVWVYRKGPAAAKKVKTREETLLEELREDMGRFHDRLREMNKRHREMRENWVKEFSAWNTYSEDIQAFAARALLFAGYAGVNVDRLAGLTGVKLVSGSRGKEPDPQEWNQLLVRRTGLALLATVYAKLETESEGYYQSNWNSKLNLSVWEHHKPARLDVLYEGLESLGYGMSQEERELRDGSHPIFKEIRERIKRYKKDLKKG